MFRGRPSRFDPREVVRLYQKGMSLIDIHKHLGISISHAHKILKEEGITRRTPHEALLLHKKGWQRVQKFGHANTRLITLPKSMLERAGLKPEEVGWGFERGLLAVGKPGKVRSEQAFAPPSLYINPASQVVCTIPARTAWMLGHGPGDELEGRWTPNADKLRLELRRRGGAERPKPTGRKPKDLGEELKELELDLKGLEERGFPIERQLARIKSVRRRLRTHR